jgi:ABC-2 type transport system ATP-binding protein
MPTVEITSLTKKFGPKKKPAVDDLSLAMEQGDAMGFIGPNGAGKTTTMRIMASLLPPTDGDVTIEGWSVTRFPEQAKSLVGFLPDEFGIYRNVRVQEFLEFFAGAYRIPKLQRKKAIEDVIELTDLQDMRKSNIDSLSRGMRQRVFLAKTLLPNPPLLILDEPAANLDPRARIELKGILNALKKMGRTIFISSHILPELSDFCNKIAIIEQGRLVVCDQVSNIVEMVRPGRQFTVRCLPSGKIIKEYLEELGYVTIDGHEVEGSAQWDQANVMIHETNLEVAAELLSRIIRDGFQVVEFKEQPMNLEDVFMKVTQGNVA